MNKPKGKWKCRACGATWKGNQLYLDPTSISTKWTCHDLTCGGSCFLIMEDIKCLKS